MRRLAALALTLALLGAVPAAAAPDEMGWFYVQRLQEQLLLRGYNPGPATGELTARTRLAVAAYRHDARLDPDADLFEVLARLQYGDRVTRTRRRPLGAPDPETAAAQLMLRRLGELSAPVDGRAGDETAVAVARFRAEHGLGGQGVDAALIAALRDEASRRGAKLPSIVEMWPSDPTPPSPTPR